MQSFALFIKESYSHIFEKVSLIVCIKLQIYLSESDFTFYITYCKIHNNDNSSVFLD